MSEAATLIVTATPNPAEQAAMKEYLQRVMPLLLQAGGTVAARVMVSDVVAGAPDYKMVLAMTFERVDSLREMFASAAYQAIVPLRERGFARMDIAITRDS